MRLVSDVNIAAYALPRAGGAAARLARRAELDYASAMDASAATPDWADAAEAAVLAQACRLAGERGRWDAALAHDAATAAGLGPADAALLLPEGPRDLAVLLWRRHDEAALAAPATDAKVSRRIRAAALARIEAAMADEAAVRPCSLFLARPPNAPLALRLGWATADAIWRWAGDTSADENHYSKRALLGVVLASTLAARLARGPEAAERQLDARLADVAAFGRLTGRLPHLTPPLTALAAGLGRLRYGRSA